MTNDIAPGIWQWGLLVVAAGLNFLSQLDVARRRKSVEDKAAHLAAVDAALRRHEGNFIRLEGPVRTHLGVDLTLDK